MNSRRSGQLAAGIIALVAFAWAAWVSHISAIPAIRVFDGYWMMLGAALAFVVVAPLVWRLRREVSLVVLTVAVVLGSVAPLVVSAIRLHMPVAVRLRGAWVLGGADVVGPTLIVGFLCLWFAIRKYETRVGGGSSRTR